MLQNYNKILTKSTVFSIILEKTQIKTSTQKKSAYFTHPDFSAAKIGKKVRKLREQIRYIFPTHGLHQWLLLQLLVLLMMDAFRILNYTGIKPRSRPPQKNPHILRTPIFQRPK